MINLKLWYSVIRLNLIQYDQFKTLVFYYQVKFDTL